jgi:lipid-binding SYLF domain-containing protein
MTTRATRNRLVLLPVILAITATLSAGGCSTAPKEKNAATVVQDSLTATEWFRRNVEGLNEQLNHSAGHISFPGVGQYGIIIAGGTFGRGVVSDVHGEHIGWAYTNTVSAGLQLGGQGYKMLIIFEDAATMEQFKTNKLTGNVGATVVAGGASKSGKASFTNGVAIYQGDAKGLMAGASVGLEYIRFEPK